MWTQLSKCSELLKMGESYHIWCGWRRSRTWWQTCRCTRRWRSSAATAFRRRGGSASCWTAVQPCCNSPGSHGRRAHPSPAPPVQVGSQGRRCHVSRTSSRRCRTESVDVGNNQSFCQCNCLRVTTTLANGSFRCCIVVCNLPESRLWSHWRSCWIFCPSYQMECASHQPHRCGRCPSCIERSRSPPCSLALSALQINAWCFIINISNFQLLSSIFFSGLNCLLFSRNCKCNSTNLFKQQAAKQTSFEELQGSVLEVHKLVDLDIQGIGRDAVWYCWASHSEVDTIAVVWTNWLQVWVQFTCIQALTWKHHHQRPGRFKGTLNYCDNSSSSSSSSISMILFYHLQDPHIVLSFTFATTPY